MPRACPVVVHARRYTPVTSRRSRSRVPLHGLDTQGPHGCHGLVPWWFTLAATLTSRRSRSRVPLHGLDTQGPHGCHGLVPWWFTLAAT
ncbi:MAG: hypothetical protein ACQESR_22520, partial [Planctomycetota bacterium]